MNIRFRIQLLGSIIFSVLFNSCSQSNSLWPKDYTALIATYYELNIADTAQLFVTDATGYRLLDLTDSLVVKRDTVFYKPAQSGLSPYFDDVSLQTVKTNSSNPSVKEFYTLEHGAVKLAGYATCDSLNPATKFKEPLVILPTMEHKVDSSVTVMQNWNNLEQRFDDATKIKTVVKLLKQGEMEINGQAEIFFIYQITLTGDGMVGYGDKQLIVPDAVFIQSNLVYTKHGGLLYEWSIKTKPVPSCMQASNMPAEPVNYIELIKYQKI